MDGNGWMDGWGEVGVGVLEVWKQLKLDHWVQNQGGKNQRGRKKNISWRRGGRRAKKRRRNPSRESLEKERNA